MAEPMNFDNAAYAVDDDIIPEEPIPGNENNMSTDNILDPNRVEERNPLAIFPDRAHAQREAAGNEIMELSQLSDAPRPVNTDLLRDVELIDEKDKFINKYMQKNCLKLKNENRNRLYSNLNIDEYGDVYFEKDIKLTMDMRGIIGEKEPYSQSSIKAPGASKFKKYFKALKSGETPMIAGRALMQPVNLDPRFRMAQHSPEENIPAIAENEPEENIPLNIIAENEPETGFMETSFSEPELRNRNLKFLSAEPTMADQQRIFEALRDVDIVEFVQEPKGENIEIDIQLKNAKHYKFKLKEAEANLKMAKEHENDGWIHDIKKEIESIELHLKTIAGKLARLYADKFYDSSLTLPTRLRYLIKLKGFKIGVIVSSIGVSFAALIAGLIETFTPSVAAVKKVVEKAGDVAAIVMKRAEDVIVPIVNSAYDNIGTFVKKIIGYIIEVVKKIIGYIGAFLFGIMKNIMEYIFDHIIILIGVIIVAILSIAMSRSKNKYK